MQVFRKALTFLALSAFATLGMQARPASAQSATVTPAAASNSPTGLTAVPGNTLVTLSWDAVTSASSYNIYRGTAPGGEGAVPIKSGVVTTSFTDTGRTNGTTYFYRVTSIGATGLESVHSPEVSATPLAYPDSPAGLSGTPGNHQATLTWTGAGIGVSYYVYRGTVPGREAETPVASLVTTATWTDSGLTNGTNYYYVIRAMRGGLVGAASSEASVTPWDSLVAPSGLKIESGDAMVFLSWNVVPGATSYNVRRSLSKGGPYAVIASVGAPRYTDINLRNGTVYYYVVTAVSGSSESPYSANDQVGATGPQHHP